MMGGGSPSTVEKVMRNTGKMEEEKGAEVSMDKTKWMKLKKRSGREGCDLKVEVKGGEIGRTETYNFLGNWVNEQGNLDTQLTAMKKKVHTYVSECNVIASQHKVGKMEIEAKLLIYENVIKISLLYNMEAWSNIRQIDYNKMEVLQGCILKRLIGLPDSTPYWGLLFELQMWPVRMEILYKKLMLYHGIMNSEEERAARRIFEDQERCGMKNCWVSEVIEESGKIGMVVNEKRVKKMSKEKWKNESKTKIQREVERMERVRINDMTKLRFLQKTRGRQTYLTNTYNDDARTALRIRLNMLTFVKTNFGMKGSCPLCGQSDSTEHVILCEKMEHGDLGIDDLEQGTRMEAVVNLCNTTEETREMKLKGDVEEEIRAFLNENAT